MPELPRKQSTIAVCIALAAGTLALYLPILWNGFINFDDNAYITENPHVTAGLTWPGIVWAFKTNYAANWHPLTWISHMIDCHVFGLNSAGHHFVNILLHTANTLLLFILLNNLTGARWRSAFAAALFAWHPLHVESVAWASERKDVLSAFFWMLTLIAYGQYVKARESNRTPQSITTYILALILFACGLMSKPMVVTLPFVLLLLDFWPLGRLRASTFLRLLVEKIPFLVLSLGGSAITYLIQKSGGAVVVNEPLSFRIANVLWSYGRYIAKLFWPTDLSIVYPFQTHGLLSLAVLSAFGLAVCSCVFIFLTRRWPYLFTGWFWFLGTLVPVIGIVEVGSASMADRYSYIPSIGLFILVTWGVTDIFKSLHQSKILPVPAIAALVACLFLTSIQIKYWRNSITLFRHALAVTKDNYVACACLGQALDADGQDTEALKYCREAVQIDPDYPAGTFFLGKILWKQGDQQEAMHWIDAAARIRVHDPVFQYNLGKFLLEHGAADEAARHFKAALDDDPDFSEAHNALGKTLLQQRQLQQAADQLSQAVTLEPNNAQFHYDLGTVLLAGSQSDHAIAQFSEAVRLDPDFADAQENLAAALAGQGRLAEAIPHFLKVVQLKPKDPNAHFNFGFACLNNLQPAEAAAQFTEELQLAPNETKAHYRLAQALMEQDKLADAVLHYRQALQLTPDFPEAKKELDEILAAHPQLR